VGASRVGAKRANAPAAEASARVLQKAPSENGSGRDVAGELHQVEACAASVTGQAATLLQGLVGCTPGGSAGA